MGTYTLTNEINDYPNFKQYNYTLPPPFFTPRLKISK